MASKAPRYLYLASVSWEGYGIDVLRILATGQEMAEKEAARIVRSREVMPGGTLLSVTRVAPTPL